MSVAALTRDAVLRIGEVCGVDGRKIFVLVDKNKNLSDMFLDGDLLRNISVNSYIEIRKGFLSIIGRVEGEDLEVDGNTSRADQSPRDSVNKNKRVLRISLSGYLDEHGQFVGGTKELPLIGDEAYIVTRRKLRLVHRLVSPDSPSIRIATVFGDDFEIDLPVDDLFNSHIAIFGNTGSGKTNTLAYLYQELIRALRERNQQSFRDNTRFILFDFNGEYAGAHCITADKTVYTLSTRTPDGDRLPMEPTSLLDLEALSILADATERTQKPFLRRAVNLYKRVQSKDDPEAYVKAILRQLVESALQLTEIDKAHLAEDYFREILPKEDDQGHDVNITADREWHGGQHQWRLRGQQVYLNSSPQRIPETLLYRHVDTFAFAGSLIENLIVFLYIQLITDVLANRALNEHIAPVINRLKAKRDDIDRVFDLGGGEHFWAHNVVIVNLHDVNLEMKKTLPLLLSKQLYAEHKRANQNKTLTIIIDEAHNILSLQSYREAESWKDYRLETFEEIIKEGRKFGVFMTISSQRPNDISPTITSQAHNYFIHRLVNELDLKTISSAVSYIDRVTEESIPTLPTGTCVFSGVASQMPLKLNVKPLDVLARPHSTTRRFQDVVPPPGHA